MVPFFNIRTSVIESKISALLAEKFQEEGFDDCFLLEAKLHANNKLDVFIDSDTGVTFEKCQRISRYLEQHLDEGMWLGEKYTLEVSSPGIGRPLKLRRQYPRNLGRKMEISMVDGSSKTGTLLAVGEDSITLEEKEKIKEGKRNVTRTLQSEIPFEQIKKAVVKVSF